MSTREKLIAFRVNSRVRKAGRCKPETIDEFFNLATTPRMMELSVTNKHLAELAIKETGDSCGSQDVEKEAQKDRRWKQLGLKTDKEWEEVEDDEEFKKREAVVMDNNKIATELLDMAERIASTKTAAKQTWMIKPSVMSQDDSLDELDAECVRAGLKCHPYEKRDEQGERRNYITVEGNPSVIKKIMSSVLWKRKVEKVASTNKIASELIGEILRVAKNLTGSLKITTVTSFPDGNPDNTDVVRSLLSLVKSNEGKYKSDKQGSYYVRAYGRGGHGISDVSRSQVNSNVPTGTEFAIKYEELLNARRYGGKHRWRVYVFYMDSWGIIKCIQIRYRMKDTQVERHNDRTGERWTAWESEPVGVKKVELKFERPSHAWDEVEQAKAGKVDEYQIWYDANKERVETLLREFEPRDNFSKDIFEKLKDGMLLSENQLGSLWDSYEASTGDDYPLGPIKDTINLKVKKVDMRDGTYGSYYVVMGMVKGYAQFGFIRLGDAAFDKFADSIMGEPPPRRVDGLGGGTFYNVENVSAAARGRTIEISGTFESNGDMIFGKRVKIG